MGQHKIIENKQKEKTAYISNEIISGVLNISLEEQFQGHNLQVALEGFEETHFTYTVSTGSGKHRRTRTVYAHGFNNFVNFAIPVYDFAMGSGQTAFTMHPGQWQIPFQMKIADKLPSSMNYFFNQSTRCNLKYRLTASIISTEANVKPLQGSQEIFIGQQVQTLLQPVTASQISAPLTCCCCQSGNFKQTVTADQASYSPNETVNVEVDCDFSSYKKSIIGLQVELRGTIIMKTNNTVRTKVISCFSKSVQLKVTGTSIKEKVQIPIPADISLSCAGQLISVVYTVAITPQIDALCCLQANFPCQVVVVINPTPQQFGNIPIPAQMQIQAPQNWNPTQLQQVQFNPQQAEIFQQQQNMLMQQQQAMYQQQYGMVQVDNNNMNAVNAAQPMQPMNMTNQNQAFL